jgi:hypothetical protein
MWSQLKQRLSPSTVSIMGPSQRGQGFGFGSPLKVLLLSQLL